MGILLIDFEATGVDPKEARTLEIGAMVVGDDFEKLGPSFSQLVWEQGYPELTKEVSEVTGLTMDVLLRESMPPVPSFKAFFAHLLGCYSDQIKYVIAYNKSYDETLFRAEMARLELDSPAANFLLSTPWLCAARDVEKFPAAMKKMMYLALDCGVAVDPKELHRAINDVELMRKILQSCGVTPDEMYAYSQIPHVVIQALVPFERKDEAKKLGYSWEIIRTEQGEMTYKKSWVKRIKETKLADEKKAATFEIQIL